MHSKIEDWGGYKKGERTYQLAILSSRNGGDYIIFCDLLKPYVAAEVPSMLFKLSKTP